MPSFNPRNFLSAPRFLPPSLADDENSAADLQKVYRHRLSQLRAQMQKESVAACLLFDALNIRYATGARNMQIFTSRNPGARYAFIPAAGKVVLFEFPGCAHLAKNSVVDEVRPAVAASAVASEKRQAEMIKRWANDIADLMPKGILAMESATIHHQNELQKRGFKLMDAQQLIEKSRANKSADEIKLIKESIAAVDAGVESLRATIQPGLGENELWAILHRAIIRADGDYIETRLMSSGTRTNPWFQECSSKKIKSGELIALDTDVVGTNGYYADYSRTFFCGKKPSARQKFLYQLAYEQIQHNLSVIRAGMSFRDIAQQAWTIPDEFADNRYFVLAHGVGMSGEYPYILHAQDFDDAGYDGVLQPMTTLCIESYIGGKNDKEGVKLEEQILVGENGCEALSTFPFEENLLRREF